MERSKTGFTLIEMSVVLVIVGLVIMIVYPALNVVRQSAQQSTTQTNLATVMRATAAFVQANGCVPCPTKASASGAAFGRVRGDELAAACGACVDPPEGIVPFVSLGLPVSTAKDGWGHWLTMRVDPALTTNDKSIIPPSSVCLSTDLSPCVQGESRKGLCRADLITTTSNPTIETQNAGTQKAAVVFVSHGANGFGAYQNDLLLSGFDNNHPLFGGTSATEALNADGDTAFYQGIASPDPLTYFDDQLAYLSRNALVAFLGNQGCQTPW